MLSAAAFGPVRLALFIEWTSALPAWLGCCGLDVDLSHSKTSASNLLVVSLMATLAAKHNSLGTSTTQCVLHGDLGPRGAGILPRCAHLLRVADSLPRLRWNVCHSQQQSILISLISESGCVCVCKTGCVGEGGWVAQVWSAAEVAAWHPTTWWLTSTPTAGLSKPVCLC